MHSVWKQCSHSVKRRRICIPEILKALCDSEIMHCEGISREAAGRFLWKQCHRLFLLSLCATAWGAITASGWESSASPVQDLRLRIPTEISCGNV
ncbi:uncharacterized protein LOC110228307 isoform X2 [Arabidopsis lyrata subsp. lyrata]|uniref:uncharacterized protein LOC110228307 isoform X2 n=1 Tax=Arabidopsis lyrata subsp. lyrata TaxID=81972 RepID=UPI000A29E71C|nr:uncharacterized protein LOC110228307 isoform X2 [Arabidopsis lyrata subsp. lyrata]|eukprot:XP_020880853.1 uncharacterized protein LOC110228307 isoform X2 [Arabidopsis lyrata subsp. lyrata]